MVTLHAIKEDQKRFIMPENDEMVQEKAAVKETCCSTITAQDVRVKDSAVCTIDAATVKLDHSVVGYAQADTLSVKNTAILIANAKELKGDVSPVFTPQTAAIFGLAFGVGSFISSQFFGLIARR